jgi:predicted esterase
MKKRIVVIIIVMMLIGFTLMGQESEKVSDKASEKKYSDYSEVYADVMAFYRQKKYAEAVAVLEQAVKQFPEKLSAITFNMAVLYNMLGKVDKCMGILEYGLERKVTYAFWPGAGPFAPLEKEERFKKIMETNTRLQAEATAKNEAKVVVVTPEGYSDKDQKKYPLIIALHGWNMNAESFKKMWNSPKTGKEYIQAYIRSSQVLTKNTAGWTDFQLGRKDVSNIYNKLIKDYPVDTGKVIIAGFSQGGQMALDIAVHNIIPSAGFVALKPGGGIPENFNLDAVKKAHQRGLRGVIITGDKDHSLEDQKKMAKMFDEAGLPNQLMVNPDQGHWFSKDFPTQLEKAVNYIFPQK